MISHMVSITRIRVRIGGDAGKVRVRVSRASFRVRVSHFASAHDCIIFSWLTACF